MHPTGPSDEYDQGTTQRALTASDREAVLTRLRAYDRGIEVLDRFMSELAEIAIGRWGARGGAFFRASHLNPPFTEADEITAFLGDAIDQDEADHALAVVRWRNCAARLRHRINGWQELIDFLIGARKRASGAERDQVREQLRIIASDAHPVIGVLEDRQQEDVARFAGEFGFCEVLLERIPPSIGPGHGFAQWMSEVAVFATDGDEAAAEYLARAVDLNPDWERFVSNLLARDPSP